MTIANRPSGSNTQPITLQLKVDTSRDPNLSVILMDTVYKYSHLCNLVSQIVFDRHCTDRSNLPYKVSSYDIHNLTIDLEGQDISLYYYLVQYCQETWKNDDILGWFPTGLLQQVFTQVAGSYNSMLTKYRNTKSLKRRDKLLTKPATFDKYTPVQYNGTTVSYKQFEPSPLYNLGCCTLSTSTNRTVVPFVYGDQVRDHLKLRDPNTNQSIFPWEATHYVKNYLKQYNCKPELLGSRIKGAKLIYRKVTTRKKSRRHPGKSVTEGQFFLYVTLEKRTPKVTYNTTELPLVASDYLGVDLGITNIATTSNGTNYSGSKLDRTRERHATRRSNLQKAIKVLPSRQRCKVKRKLKNYGSKEYRFHKDVNHCLSKRIVEEATRTCSVIVLEDLSGIREQLKARRKQRSRMHSWSYAQLQEYITYKAKLAGVRVITIDPRHTSERCSRCGHTERSNRGSGTRREQFVCKCCKYEIHSDYNAAINIRDVGHILDPLVAAA